MVSVRRFENLPQQHNQIALGASRFFSNCGVPTPARLLHYIRMRVSDEIRMPYVSTKGSTNGSAGDCRDADLCPKEPYPCIAVPFPPLPSHCLPPAP